METPIKALALVKFLYEDGPRKRKNIKQDGDLFMVENKEYLVLFDDEATARTIEYIEDSIWGFRPKFLSRHIDLTPYEIAKIQELCEKANPILKRMIDDFDGFCEDAINTDGRGHFLSDYDGEENHINYKGLDFYIYRIN